MIGSSSEASGSADTPISMMRSGSNHMKALRSSACDGSSPSDLLDLIGKELSDSDDDDEEQGAETFNDSLEALVQKRLHEERNRNHTFASLAKNRHQELMKKQQDEIDVLMSTLQARNKQCSDLRRQLQVQQRQIESSATRRPTAHQEGGGDPRDYPRHFLCPITQDLLVSPVTAADGHTYEMTAILRWMTSHSTSPVAGSRLPSFVIIPNYSMRSQIAEYMQSRGLDYSCSDFSDVPPWAGLTSSRSHATGGIGSSADAAESSESDSENELRPRSQTGSGGNGRSRIHALWRRMQL